MLHSCILAARSLNNIDMHCPYCTWASGRPYSSQTPTGNVSEDASQFITLTTEFWTYLTIGMVQLSGSSTIEYYEVSGGGVWSIRWDRELYKGLASWSCESDLARNDHDHHTSPIPFRHSYSVPWSIIAVIHNIFGGKLVQRKSQTCLIL
jgi:hypothetical protein